MTKKRTSPQQERKLNNCDDKERLYRLINKYVKRVTFSRLKIEPDEIVSEAYLRLVENPLPDFGTDEFRITVLRTVKRIVWNHRRPGKPMLDVDELEEEEHPFYEVDFFSEEEEFELVFAQFCDSFPEPKRTVFAKSRILSHQDIAALVGIKRQRVTKILKLMPGLFKKFFEEFSKNFSR